MNHRNLIIAAPRFEKELMGRRYNKEIIFSIYAPNDRWLYFSKTGQMRTVMDNSVWTSILDECGFPTGYIKKLRPRSAA